MHQLNKYVTTNLTHEQLLHNHRVKAKWKIFSLNVGCINNLNEATSTSSDDEG